MRSWLVTLVAAVLAIVGWWGLYELTSRVGPDEAGGRPLFLALLFLALTATRAPAAAYLNRRFAPGAAARDPARFIRHSAWAGLCLTAWAWLQMQRILNLGFALVIALIFIALEYVIIRLRRAEQDDRG